MIDALPVTDDIAARMLALPLTDAMTDGRCRSRRRHADRDLRRACRASRPRRARRRATACSARSSSAAARPATALLCAAGKAGRLDALARAGIAMRRSRRDDRRRPARRLRDHLGQLGRDLPHRRRRAARRPRARRRSRRARDRASIRARSACRCPRSAPISTGSARRSASGCASLGGDVLDRPRGRLGAARPATGCGAPARAASPTAPRSSCCRATLVIATGGHQPAIRLAEEKVAGASLVERCGDRLIQSDTVLADGGLRGGPRRMLPARPPARGSPSSADRPARSPRRCGCSRPPTLVASSAAAIALLHRRPLRPFYPSADAARADGYDDFGPDDICPVSGFVYRLAGFRLEARELVVHALGIGGRVGDPRLRSTSSHGDGRRAPPPICSTAPTSSSPPSAIGRTRCR